MFKIQLASVSGLTNLQGEKKSLPFFSPEVRQDGGGSDGEHQWHQDASLQQHKQWENSTYDNLGRGGTQKYKELYVSVCVYLFFVCVIPCGSSEGTASDPQKADTLPAPEQCLDIHQTLLHKAVTLQQSNSFLFMP